MTWSGGAEPSTLRRTIVGLLAAASLLLALRFVLYETRLLAYWPQWEICEAWSLNHARLLAAGEPLYRIREAPPLIVPQYGFVYPAVVAPLVPLLGPSLFAPRLVSLLCVLALLAAVVVAVRFLGSPPVFALIAVGLVLLKINWWRFLVLGRPDALGTLLLFMALLVHWRWPRARGAVLACVFLLVAAFFTKVYFVLGAVSVALSYALVHRDRAWTVRFILLFALVFGVSLGGVFVWTGGLYWVFTFEILSLLLRYSTSLGLYYLGGFLVTFLPLWLLLARGVAAGRLEVERYGVFLVHILVATPATAFLLTNDGGASYYWYVVLPALVVVGCDLLYREVSRRESAFALPALLLTLASMVALPHYSEIFPSAELSERWEPLRLRVENAAGPVMNANVTAIVNIAAGKEVYTEAVGYTRNARWLHEHYGYRFLDVAERIRTRYYALLIDPEWTPELADNYRLMETLELPGQLGTTVRVDLYEPRRD